MRETSRHERSTGARQHSGESLVSSFSGSMFSAVSNPSEDSPEAATRTKGHSGAIETRHCVWTEREMQTCLFEGLTPGSSYKGSSPLGSSVCCPCWCHFVNTKWKPKAIPAPSPRPLTSPFGSAPGSDYGQHFNFPDRRYLSE